MKTTRLLLPLMLLAACSTGDPSVLENEDIHLGFHPENGALVSLCNVREGVEHLDPVLAAEQPLWDVELMPGAPMPAIPTQVSFHKKSRRALEIRWTQPEGREGLSVHVTVSLKKDRPWLSEWHLDAEGLEGLGIKSFRFPLVGGIRPMGEEDALVYSSWTGTLVRNPWSRAEKEPYTVVRMAPGGQCLQVEAFYNPSHSGIYMGSEDTESNYKEYVFSFDRNEAFCCLNHYLRLDIDTASYSVPYPSVLGVFKGDWLTVAQLYRPWGVRQWWCRQSRLKNGLVPRWGLETALWVWNRGRSENVLPEAVWLKEKLGLPVNVWWHWWHGCSYDDGFPEYLPPREGREAFRKAVAEAQAKGVHCINYMNSIQWGDATQSWKEKGAAAWCGRDAEGGTYAKVYNIYSGKSITPMCPACDFWRKTYVDLCDTVVNAYGTNGVYMDQACRARLCYNAAHPHPVGGGNAYVKGHLQMIDSIRAAIAGAPTEPLLAGEGAAEDWMAHLDLGLTLEAGTDRVRAADERVPLFHAAYHDYQVTFGNMSTLVYPPYDEKWPAEYRPANAEQPLPDDFDRQFMMEQAKSFVWGVQPCIANFHPFLFDEKPEAIGFLCDMVRTRYKALDYLLYGVFQRSPEMPDFEEEIPISRLKTYVKGEDRVKRFSRVVPTLYRGAFTTEDGRLGIALANISDEDRDLLFELDPAAYGIPASGTVTALTALADPAPVTAYKGKTPVRYRLPARSTVVLECK